MIIKQYTLCKHLKPLFRYRKIKFYLNTNVRQHSYKVKYSISTVLKKTIKSYTTNDSPVSLDFSKVLDCVNRSILLNELIERNMPSKLVKSIQEVYVNYNNYNSKSWYLRNGFRQGSIISQYLFNKIICKISKQPNCNLVL